MNLREMESVKQMERMLGRQLCDAEVLEQRDRIVLELTASLQEGVDLAHKFLAVAPDEDLPDLARHVYRLDYVAKIIAELKVSTLQPTRNSQS